MIFEKMEMEINRVQVVQGKHANSSLYHVGNGYFFSVISRHERPEPITYLRCVGFRSGCQAKAYMNHDTFHCSNDHSHPPDFLRIPLLAERQRIMNEATNLQQYANLTEIFNNLAGNMFPDQINRRSMLPAMTRARLSAYPAPPQTLRELNLILMNPQFECLSATTGFEDNIYSGSTEANDGSFVILFMTVKCQEFIKFCSCVFGITYLLKIRGTPLEYHVHVLATIWDDTILILGWIVLERSSEAAYHAAFSFLKATVGEWHIRLVLCKDNSFEASAYTRVFPSVQVNCTVYHFTQSLCEKIVSSGVQLNAEEIAQSKLLYLMGLCCALPMIPTNFMNEALSVVRREIVTEHQYCQLLMEVLNYFEGNYVNNPRRSCIFSACGSSFRTSTVCENIDISIRQNLTQNSFYSFARYLTTVAERTAQHIQKIEQGFKPRGRAACSLSEDSEIDMLTKSLVHPFLSSSAAILNLLKAVALKQQHILVKFLHS